MKLSPLLLAAIAIRVEGKRGRLAKCQKRRPTVDLSNALAPLAFPPSMYPDKDGVTRAKLFYDLVDYVGASFTTVVRAFNGGLPGPTLHVEPGGSLELELINCLQLPLGFHGKGSHNRYHHPNSTNMHTHGPHVTANSPGDNVFIKIEPQETHQYEYNFDDNHMPGTFWYHPHLHGSTAVQVGSGAAGLIIMDDPKDYNIPDSIRNMESVEMLFQHMDLNILRQSANVSEDMITDWVSHNFEITNKTTSLTNFILINMQFLPKITMEVGKWYRWRMALSSIRASIAFLSQSGKCEMQLIAKDGIYLPTFPRSVDQIILSPGNRADVAVRCTKVGEESMNTTFIDLRCDPDSPQPNYGCFEPLEQYSAEADAEVRSNTPVEDKVGVFMDPKEQPTILVIDVVSTTTTSPDKDLEPFTVIRPCYLVDLQAANVDKHFMNHYFCFNEGQTGEEAGKWPDNATPMDTCGVFGPYGKGDGGFDEFTPWVDADTYINDFETGSIQEVDLKAVQFHPYHQHVNPFQIIEINSYNTQQENGGVIQSAVADWYKVGDWHDTLQFPAAGFGPKFVVTMRFQADQFTGHMVQHCHLLFHEDQGMMAQYDVTGNEGVIWDGARKVDPTCVLPESARKGKSNKAGKAGKRM